MREHLPRRRLIAAVVLIAVGALLCATFVGRWAAEPGMSQMEASGRLWPWAVSGLAALTVGLLLLDADRTHRGS